MSQVVGIDLGTTNTVVSAVREGRAVALPDEQGQTLIPSVVSFHPNGSVLVGRAAKDRRVIDPKSTVYSVKRLIGRSWNTEEVRRARSRLPFEMREGPGQAALIAARGETYTLPEISAFVLRKAKTVAEAALGTPVERAVITVPANFNDLQRAATKVAGRVAGLEVLRILNEPTAAALAYGYGKSSAERIAVYDFGGGTFDVTLLDLSSNVFEVLATAGNTFLGGDDIDVAVAERMADIFLRQHRYDVREDPIAFDRFRLAAEELKQRLSSEETASVHIPDVTHGPGGRAIDFIFELARGEVELLASKIVDQTFEVCEEALGVARLDVKELDQVLLVGGSTRMPLVRRRVEEFFRREGQSNLSPDEVVAMGAAIQASALGGAERRRAAIPSAPAPARRASTKPGVGTRTMPGGGPPAPEAAVGRLRPGAGPDANEPAPSHVPATQPFEQRRNAPTRPGLQPRASASAEQPDELGSGTLVGLGNRGRVKTGAGLGPDAASAKAPHAPTLESAVHAAAEARAELARGAEATGGGLRALSAPLDMPLPDLPDDDDAPTQVTAPEPAFATPAAPLSPLAVPTLPFTLPLAASPDPVPAEAPVLVDVTPLTLSVETVGGYCDPIIGRNTPVPCDKTREFVTATDNQTTVRVRVGQGESSQFAQNTLLGELELSGLRAGVRGTVQISVTFSLDTNGMLHVSARDTQTGRATTAELHLVGLPDQHQIHGLAERHAAQRAG